MAGTDISKDEDNTNETASSAAEPLPAAARPAWQSVLIVATCTLAMITNLASGAAVSIFLPVIGQDLNIPEAQLQWIVSSFSLSSGCLLLPLGRLADLFGRKTFFLLGTVWLGVFSLGCGFVQNSTTLYILRGLQGIGPAAFIPACLGILAHAFPPSRARSIAFATFSAGAPVGGAIGTQIGALLSQNTRASWRSPFFLFAGLSLLCVLGGICTIDADVPSTEEDKRVDWIGAGLVTAGLVLLLFVLGQGQAAPRGWRTAYILALLVLAVLLLALFVIWQHRLETRMSIGNENGKSKGRPPLMKLSLWSRAEGRFAVMQAIAFLQWAAFLSWYFWAQVYYEDYVRLPPVFTALRMLPMTVAGFLCNVFVVLVIGRVDLAVLIASGTLLTSTGALLLALIRPAASYWAFGFPSPIVAVFGADFVFAAGTLFVAKVARGEEQSLAGGLFQTLTQLGTAFGLAITTIVHNAVADRHTNQRAGEGAPLEAYQAAQWTAFGMGVLCTLFAAGFLRGVGPVGVHGPPTDQEVQMREDGERKGEGEKGLHV